MNTKRLVLVLIVVSIAATFGGCTARPGGGNTPSAWVGGGAYLKTWQEGATVTPQGVNSGLATTSLIFWENTNSLLSDSENPEDYLMECICPKLFFAGGSDVKVMDAPAPGTTPVVRSISTGGKTVSAVTTFAPLAGEYVYAAHPDDNSVSQIGPMTEKVLGNLKIGISPMRLAGRGGGVYALGSGKIVQVSFGPAGNKIYATADVGTGATDVAYSENSKYVVVTDFANDIVYVFDSDLNLLGKINTNGVSPHSVIISNYSPKAYVTAFKGTDTGDLPGSLLVIDLDALAITNTVPVGTCPIDPKIVEVDDPDDLVGQITGIKSFHDQSVLVANACDDTVTKIDVASKKVVQTIKVGSSPLAIAVQP